MKIYDWHIAPNPRRLHIYLAEKGIKVDYVEVGGGNFKLKPEYIAKYPHADAGRVGAIPQYARGLRGAWLTVVSTADPMPPGPGRSRKGAPIDVLR